MIGTLGQSGQTHHAVHGHGPSKSQGARGDNTGAQAGEGAGPGTGQNRVQLLAANAGLLQGGVGEGGHDFGVGAGIFALEAGQDIKGSTGFGAVHAGERHGCGGG